MTLHYGKEVVWLTVMLRIVKQEQGTKVRILETQNNPRIREKKVRYTEKIKNCHRGKEGAARPIQNSKEWRTNLNNEIGGNQHEFASISMFVINNVSWS